MENLDKKDKGIEKNHEKQDGVTPKVKKIMGKNVETVLKLNSMLRRERVDTIKVGDSGPVNEENSDNYREKDHEDFQKRRARELGNPINKLYRLKNMNNNFETENERKEEVSEVDPFEEAKKGIKDFIDERVDKVKKGYEEKDAEKDKVEELINEETKDVDIQQESTPPLISPEKIKKLEKILESIEEQRDLELVIGSLSSKIKNGVISGLDKWENFGKGEEGVKGFAKRFTKMAVNLALIGVISSISVEKLAEAGIGTATALSGGVTSYLGRKMAIGLGIGGAMELGGKKIPDKVKKWIPVALGVAGVGAAIVFSGGLAGVLAGVSAGTGYAASKLIKGKFTNEQITKREEEAKQKFSERIGEGETFSVKEIEKEYIKILKKYENQKIWGKLLDGATKLGVGALVSAVSMEASGLARDFSQHQLIIDKVIEKETISPEPKIEVKPEEVTIPVIPQHINVEAIADHGQGAISTLRELQHNLKEEYGDNLENAPESVRHILNTDAHKLAQEYGMYKPGQDAESAFIKSGSSFRVDESGNVTYHEVNGKDITLEKGTENTASTSYEGKMADTDNSGGMIKDDINEYKLPEQIDPITGEPIIQVEQTDLTGDKYKLPPQIDPVTGESMVQEEIINNDGNVNIQDHINLSSEELGQVHAVYTENINHIFPTEKLMGTWDHIKNNISAERLMEINKEGGVIDTYKPLVSYMDKLKEISGIHPITKIPLISEAESIPNYINRALQKVAEMGQLEKVKL